MTRLIIVAAASIGIILFAAFIIARLAQTRTRGMSVRMQVFLALAGIVGTFAFGLGLMVIDRIEARAVRLSTQAARDEGATIAGMLAGDMLRTGTNLDTVVSRFEQERSRGADIRLEIIDPKGTIVFPRSGKSAAELPGHIFVDTPIIVEGNSVGAVRVVKPTVVVERLLADFAPTVLVISLVLGAAAALAAAWIGHAIAQPIVALTGFSERVSQGERTAAPPPVFGREVTRLSRSIDSMRRQLEGRPFVETFAADLSHELKNPVAAIRASAEILDDGGALDEPEEARRFVKRIREATDRIERLTRDLLNLAHIEARGVEDVESIDLASAVGELVRCLDERAQARLTLDLETGGDTRVRGDPLWLSRALGNLIENALVHSKGPVTLQLQRDRTDVCLRVLSEGEVPKPVRQRVFARFFTTREDKGGTGLGLSIARAVAEAHGGRVELVSAGPPEVEFRLTLPPARKFPSQQVREVAASVRGIGVADDASP